MTWNPSQLDVLIKAGGEGGLSTGIDTNAIQADLENLKKLRNIATNAFVIEQQAYKQELESTGLFITKLQVIASSNQSVNEIANLQDPEKILAWKNFFDGYANYLKALGKNKDRVEKNLKSSFRTIAKSLKPLYQSVKKARKGQLIQFYKAEEIAIATPIYTPITKKQKVFLALSRITRGGIKVAGTSGAYAAAGAAGGYGGYQMGKFGVGQAFKGVAIESSKVVASVGKALAANALLASTAGGAAVGLTVLAVSHKIYKKHVSNVEDLNEILKYLENGMYQVVRSGSLILDSVEREQKEAISDLVSAMNKLKGSIGSRNTSKLQDGFAKAIAGLLGYLVQIDNSTDLLESFIRGVGSALENIEIMRGNIVGAIKEILANPNDKKAIQGRLDKLKLGLNELSKATLVVEGTVTQST